jgi:hypothetical protein
MENKKILQDETMASVSGGFIFADSKGQFCIIDETGNEVNCTIDKFIEIFDTHGLEGFIL